MSRVLTPSEAQAVVSTPLPPRGGPPASAPHPDFFLAGAPKCGTSALHSFLWEHPDIFLPDTKDVHFYGSDMNGLSARRTPQQHAELFAKAGGHKRVGETAIWALYSKNAAKEIRKAVPNAQIVLMLRNPVDMLYALHNEFVYWNLENVANFGKALLLEQSRRHGRSIPCDTEPASIFRYREVATFSTQVERYLREFGRPAVHVVLFDDFKRDARGVCRQLFQFLGVDPEFVPNIRNVNPSKRVRSTTLRKWMSDPNPILQLGIHALIPVRLWRSRLEEKVKAWNVGTAAQKPMRNRTRMELQAYFTPEIARLSQLLGRDLSVWLRPPYRSY